MGYIYIFIYVSCGQYSKLECCVFSPRANLDVKILFEKITLLLAQKLGKCW